jgi:hypothetical protein
MMSMGSTILRGIEISLGIVLLALGGWIGLENWPSSEILNIPLMVFSAAAMLVGLLFLWFAYKN